MANEMKLIAAETVFTFFENLYFFFENRSMGASTRRSLTLMAIVFILYYFKGAALGTLRRSNIGKQMVAIRASKFKKAPMYIRREVLLGMQKDADTSERHTAWNKKLLQFLFKQRASFAKLTIAAFIISTICGFLVQFQHPSVKWMITNESQKQPKVGLRSRAPLYFLSALAAIDIALAGVPMQTLALQYGPVAAIIWLWMTKL